MFTSQNLLIALFYYLLGIIGVNSVNLIKYYKPHFKCQSPLHIAQTILPACFTYQRQNIEKNATVLHGKTKIIGKQRSQQDRPLSLMHAWIYAGVHTCTPTQGQSIEST